MKTPMGEEGNVHTEQGLICVKLMNDSVSVSISTGKGDARWGYSKKTGERYEDPSVESLINRMDCLHQ